MKTFNWKSGQGFDLLSELESDAAAETLASPATMTVDQAQDPTGNHDEEGMILPVYRVTDTLTSEPPDPGTDGQPDIPTDHLQPVFKAPSPETNPSVLNKDFVVYDNGESAVGANAARDVPDALVGESGDWQSRAKPPVEVNPIFGTDNDDIISVTSETVPDNWTLYATAHDGDDLILRDRTGSYSQVEGIDKTVTINGGGDGSFGGENDTGSDTVSYAGLDSRIEVDLDTFYGGGRAQQLQPAGEQPYGFDVLNGIENIVATSSHDTIEGDNAANKFWGMDGNDEIDGKGGSDQIWGGFGNDVIDGGAGDDTMHGDAGDDVINGGFGTGEDTAYGGDGNDTINGGGGNDTLHGNDGNDTINGGKGADEIDGGDGDDTLNGGGGSDDIYVGDGTDIVDAGAGNDTIFLSGFGDNTVFGGSGSDKIVFGNQSMTVNMSLGVATRSDGQDTFSSIENVQTGSGFDSITGSNFANNISTGGGSDTIFGKGGDDTIHSGSGDDTVNGDAGDDDIISSWGDDYVHGGGGADTIQGGSGSDAIRGGWDADELWGGSDSDTFIWHVSDHMGGYDTIHDFNLAEDKLAFGAGFFNDADGDGAVVFDEVLDLWGAGSDVILMADTDSYGWKPLANLGAIDAAVLEQSIANGSIIDADHDQTTVMTSIDWGAFDPLVAQIDWDSLPQQANFDPEYLEPLEGAYLPPEPIEADFDIDFL